MRGTRKSQRSSIYISGANLMKRAREEFGEEYFGFWAIYQGAALRVCPLCQSQVIKTLHLSLPRDSAAGKIWCKWYLWCDSCLNGIYCPPGTYRIRVTEPHILWGDEAALKKALPKGLHLIPIRSSLAKKK
jgi:hypothetical protein